MRKPAKGVPAPAMPYMIGTVKSVPDTPNAISTGRLPVRSDKAPTKGCSSMKASREIAEIKVASALLKPEVLARNFCAYVVYV